MPWLRKSATVEPLAVTMTGVKLGDRILAIGARDAPLVAALAMKAGLTGHAAAIEDSAERAAAARTAIERQGALAEVSEAPFGALPFDGGTFDVAILVDILAGMPGPERARCLDEVLRVLRPGGRAIVIEHRRRGLLRPAPAAAAGYEGPGEALRTAGFAAARLLGESGGTRFAEAVKRG